MGKAATPADIVEELPFGFWVSLLGPGDRGMYHNTLWTPALHKAFPNARGMSRKRVYKPFDQLRTLRNMIAHHRPIIQRHLSKDHERIIEVLEWMSASAALWVRDYSGFEDVRAAKPKRGALFLPRR